MEPFTDVVVPPKENAHRGADQTLDEPEQHSETIAPSFITPPAVERQATSPPVTGAATEAAPTLDETPFMTPGFTTPAEEFPFDRDIPSRMSSVATDAFETPMEELDTPRLGRMPSRDHDVEDLGPHSAHVQDDSLREESFASDRTLGEDSTASDLSATGTAMGMETAVEAQSHPVHLAGVAAGLPTTSSNQFLRSQEVQVRDIYQPSHELSKEDEPVAADDVDVGIPSAPPTLSEHNHDLERQNSP